jgi:hypothetical protein
MRGAFIGWFLIFAPIVVLPAKADEPILDLDEAQVDSPLAPNDHSSYYLLSNIRKDEAANEKLELAFDYRVKQRAKFSYREVLIINNAKGRRQFPSGRNGGYGSTGMYYQHSNNAPFQTTGTVFNQDLGKMLAVSTFNLPLGILAEDFELWIEQHIQVDGQTLRIKISNSLLMGNIQKPTPARQWTEGELNKLDKLLATLSPPREVPNGYELVDQHTELLRGMPIYAARHDKWIDAEVIDLRASGKVLVIFEDAIPDTPIHLSLIELQRDWIAVESKKLKLGKDKPNHFRPSLTVLPEGRTPYDPKQYQPLGEDWNLVPGTPILVPGFSHSWQAALAKSEESSNRISYLYATGHMAIPGQAARSQILISLDTLEEMKRTEIRKQYEEDLAQLEQRLPHQRMRAQIESHRMRISGEAPKYPVKKDTPLRVGQKLLASWGSSWWPATVLKVEENGNVRIGYDGHSSSSDETLPRERLSLVKPAVANGSDLAKSEEPTKESEQIREWTDSTGKHRTQATFLRLEEKVVHLKLKDGKEIQLPLERLSKPDQDFVNQKVADLDNPFLPKP